jgi:hypothetical protein
MESAGGTTSIRNIRPIHKLVHKLYILKHANLYQNIPPAPDPPSLDREKYIFIDDSCPKN